MRLLADNPSMEYLRQEAKDLLGSLRESDEKVTLADAQRATAELYGFRTWSELKADVERRREALPQAPEGLAEGLSEAFGLGKVTAPMTPIRYEYMGRRWCLDTERGRVMVSPVFDWIQDSQAEVAVDLQERARAAGVLSPVPVRTPNGGLVRRVLDQNWRVDEWMDLGPTPVQPVHSSVARRVGELLAALHGVAPRTDRPIQGPWVSADERPTQDHWTALLQRARAAKVDWADPLAALSPTIEDLGAVVAEVPPGSVVVTNCDITPDAVRLGEGDELIVTHWDYAGPMVPEWELASALLQWCFYSGPNVEAGRALLDGYRERAGMVPALTLGSFNVAITGWLTWTLHRAWEASGDEPPEKGEFAARALQESLSDPITVGKLQAFLDAVQPIG